MTGNLSMCRRPCIAVSARRGALKTKSLHSTNRFSMRITPSIMLNKPSIPEKFRVAALVHADILASSVTLPLEILTGANQALGRTGTHSLDIACFSGSGGALLIQSGIDLQTLPLSDLSDADLLIVPAIWRRPQRVLKRESRQIDLIAQHIAAGD